MMKLLIVEDRIVRLQQFIPFKLEQFENVQLIKEQDYRKLTMELDRNDITVLESCEVLAFHRSALTNKNRDLVKQYCKQQKKPLIYFSGGITANVFSDKEFQFLNINSKDFYSNNLELFVRSLQNDEKPNLLILQFGHRWKQNLLLNIRNNITLMLHDSKTVRLSDLKIGENLMNELTNEVTEKLLRGNRYAQVHREDLLMLKEVVSNKINELL